MNIKPKAASRGFASKNLRHKIKKSSRTSSKSLSSNISLRLISDLENSPFTKSIQA